MIINAGSCVGVLYWSTQENKWKVHNGRLVHPPQVNDQQPPHSVSVAHWNIKHQPHSVPYKEILPLSHVREVRLTQDLLPTDPRYCAKDRGKQNTILTIYPGTCFAVYFTHPKGTRDVKNGRFLYWIKKHDPPGRIHCVLHKTHIGDIKELYYAHYDTPSGADLTNFHKPPHLIPKAGMRGSLTGEDIIDVFRTTMTLQP